MRIILIGLTAVATLVGGAASAQTYDQQQRDYQDKQAQYQDRKAQYQDEKREYHHELRQWARGETLPNHYFTREFAVADWRAHRLPEPGEGHRWIRDENGNYVLVSVGTRVIEDVVVEAPGE